jgi:hypothetical protein
MGRKYERLPGICFQPPAMRPAVPTICGASERDSVRACDL